MQNLVNLKKKIISNSKKKQKQGRTDFFSILIGFSMLKIFIKYFKKKYIFKFLNFRHIKLDIMDFYVILYEIHYIEGSTTLCIFEILKYNMK